MSNLFIDVEKIVYLEKKEVKVPLVIDISTMRELQKELGTYNLTNLQDAKTGEFNLSSLFAFMKVCINSANRKLKKEERITDEEAGDIIDFFGIQKCFDALKEAQIKSTGNSEEVVEDNEEQEVGK